MTGDSMSRDAKRLWNADMVPLTRTHRERTAMRATVGIAVICLLSACIYHKWQITLAPQVSVTPINLGSGAKVSLTVLDARPTSFLAQYWSEGDNWTVTALGDLTLAIAEQLRSGLISLGFEVVRTPEASPVTLEIQLLFLATETSRQVGGLELEIVARAKGEARRGPTHVFQKTYNAKRIVFGSYGFVDFPRKLYEEEINAALSLLIGRILGDLELIAALK